MLSGLTANTFERLQLNAGVFLKGVSYSALTTLDAVEAAIITAMETEAGYLGATVGGGSFECVPTMRQIEVDGMRSPVKGSQVIDSWSVKLKGTMKEVSPTRFSQAIPASEVSGTGAKITVKIKQNLSDADYVDSLCWVGDTSKGLVLINLANALNVSGATFAFTDKGEGSIPFEFQAHLASVGTDEYLPVEIVFFNEAA